MSLSSVEFLKAEHFAVFGMITYSFARLEWLIQISIAGVGQLDFSKTIVVTRSLSYSAKRDTLYALMNNLRMSSDDRAQIKKFLDEADKFSLLRNNIAHAIWCQGSRPDSIKPMQIIIKGGSGRHIGIEDSERDWTIGELINATDKLAIISNSYLHFLRAAGYTSSIEEKILEMMDSKVSSEGARSK
jgi:hypothetical protein